MIAQSMCPVAFWKIVVLERFFKCFQVPSMEYVSCMILEVVVNIHANYYVLKIVVSIHSKIGKS
jgi:hypothetical protein